MGDAKEPTEDPSVLELELVPSSRRYDPDDPRFRQQVGRLLSDLRREAGPVRTERVTVPGAKGAAEAASVIIALGSSGALRMALHIFQEWLRRDRSRTLRVTWTAGGDLRTLVVTADELDRDGFRQLAAQAIKLEH
jgi:hypothetical protein